MDTVDSTLTSPLIAATGSKEALLVLTIAWHPDRRRIGEQFVGPGAPGSIELGRYLPLFRGSEPDAEGLGLGHVSVSRTPVSLVRDADGGVTIRPSSSRMVFALNGLELDEPVHLTRAQIARGAILGLGRTILLCLHWMECLPRHNPVPGFLGVGSAAIGVREQIRQAARSKAVVLLLGETGTGKEVAAQAIHALGQRAAAAIVCVNMATLSESLAAADLFGAEKGAYTGAAGAREGLFMQAANSTLFLDEIGNTPATVQAMLLRVIECGAYRPLGARADLQSSARLIAATDQDLYSPGFNRALLRRLEQFLIHLPPLRQRREDIGVLLRQMLPDSEQLDVPTEIISALLNHDWPGNVRELAHTFARVMLALAMGKTPSIGTMLAKPGAELAGQDTGPGAAHAGLAAPGRKKLDELQEQDIFAALQNNDWIIRAAAHELGISRPSVYKLLERYPHLRRGAAFQAGTKH